MGQCISMLTKCFCFSFPRLNALINGGFIALSLITIVITFSPAVSFYNTKMYFESVNLQHVGLKRMEHFRQA